MRVRVNAFEFDCWAWILGRNVDILEFNAHYELFCCFLFFLCFIN